MFHYKTNQVSTCHSAHHKQIKSQQVKSQCLTPVFILSLSFNSLNHQKCTFFRGVVYLFFLEEICTLVIAEAFPEDGGLFCCTASNLYGSVSSTAQLTVTPGASETD